MDTLDMFAFGGTAVVDHLANPGEMTAVELGAWPEDKIISSIEALSDDAMIAIGADLRLVVRTMSCTRKQLTEEFASVDPDDVELLIDQGKSIAACLRAFAKVVDEAVARWLLAALCTAATPVAIPAD